MMRLRRMVTKLLAFGGLVATHSCADATGGTTELELTVVTVGADRDPDGYSIMLDGDSVGHVAPQGTLIVQVTPGHHAIVLRGVSANCVAADAAGHEGDDAGQVVARWGARSSLNFEVACRANVGFAVVRVMTFGVDKDADGYLLSVGSLPPRAIEFSEDVPFLNLPVGPLVVTLSGVAENCTVTSENPVTLTVPFEAMGFAQITLTCAPNVGTIIAAAATTGFDSDPDGYTLRLPSHSTNIGIDDSVTFSGVRTGTRVLVIEDLAANCTAAFTSVTLTVTFGDTIRVTFPVTCAANAGPFGTMAFSTTRHGVAEIYLMRSDGTDLRRLNAPGREPAWSPDGSRIAFSGNRDGAPGIFVMNADGGDVRRLTTSNVNDLQPAWSPDGAKILYTSEGTFGQRSLFRMNADGTGITPLITDAESGDAVFSPDGNQIAFRRCSFTSCDIHTMKTDGTELRALAAHGAWDGMPAFSPDGSRIAFASNRAGGISQIYIMNADGSNPVRLTQPGHSTSPRFSPDGSRITFVMIDGLDTEIYTMNADGSGTRKVTSNPAMDDGPSWKPETAGGRPPD